MRGVGCLAAVQFGAEQTVLAAVSGAQRRSSLCSGKGWLRLRPGSWSAKDSLISPRRHVA